MDSKYKERARKLLENDIFEVEGDEYIDTYAENILNSMCNLAEEVEDTLLNMSTKLLQAKYPGCYFTREQVEELLHKQRELCSEVAKASEYWGDNIVEPQLVVNKQDIIDAKLKID
jgi:hypothetical protein